MFKRRGLNLKRLSSVDEQNLPNEQTETSPRNSETQFASHALLQIKSTNSPESPSVSPSRPKSGFSIFSFRKNSKGSQTKTVKTSKKSQKTAAVADIIFDGTAEFPVKESILSPVPAQNISYRGSVTYRSYSDNFEYNRETRSQKIKRRLSTGDILKKTPPVLLHPPGSDTIDRRNLQKRTTLKESVARARSPYCSRRTQNFPLD